VTDSVGFSVTGKPPPTIVKLVPTIAAEPIVTGEVPVDVNVSDFVVAVFIGILPKLTLVAFTVSCGAFDVEPWPRTGICAIIFPALPIILT
jgi:hypothetical protein